MSDLDVGEETETVTESETAKETDSGHEKEPQFAAQGCPSILVIEDDTCLQNIVNLLISRSDSKTKVTWVTTVPEAIKKLDDVASGKRPPFDLILSDLLLPNLELGTRIWRFSQRNIANTPFVIMSSIETETYLKMFLPSEAPPPFLMKPFIPNEFTNLLNFLLKGYTSDSFGG